MDDKVLVLKGTELSRQWMRNSGNHCITPQMDVADSDKIYTNNTNSC